MILLIPIQFSFHFLPIWQGFSLVGSFVLDWEVFVGEVGCTAGFHGTCKGKNFVLLYYVSEYHRSPWYAIVATMFLCSITLEKEGKALFHSFVDINFRYSCCGMCLSLHWRILLR